MNMNLQGHLGRPPPPTTGWPGRGESRRVTDFVSEAGRSGGKRVKSEGTGLKFQPHHLL